MLLRSTSRVYHNPKPLRRLSNMKPLKLKWVDRRATADDVTMMCDCAKEYVKENKYDLASECLQVAMFAMLVLKREAAAKLCGDEHGL